jgi:glycosyltransferase involved in cell wall biosynthesis
MSKKILFVVNVDWFFVSHRLPLALEALKRGYEVYIACGITDKKEYFENLGIKVYPLSLSRSGIGIKEEINVFIKIYQILKIINPDIAHFVTIKPVLYGGIASRFLKDFRKVFAISGLGFVFIKQGFRAVIVRFVVKILYSLAFGGKNSAVIVQNQDDKEVVESISHISTFLIRGSGVDLNYYTYKEENNHHIRVTMACRFLKDKGVLEYVEAAKILKSKNIDATFELYGDIDAHNPASLKSTEIEAIKQEGFVEIYDFNSDIAAVFSNSNIIVLPSYREGLPKVLIEAAACGRAVVTTDVAGCKDAIEEDLTGLLCIAKDIHSLANQIEKLILDNDLRNTMGKAGRELAQKEFDIRGVIGKHFDIYEGKI